MIEGVKIKKIEVHEDSRGDFREILRIDESIMDEIRQVSVGRSKPGVIKAFHFHKNQDDVFYVLRGTVLLVLHDKREDSTTKGETQVILLGGHQKPKTVFIPRGVLHGYKVLSGTDAETLYIMNNTYNSDNPDEGRVPFDDPLINFDWEAGWDQKK